MELQQKGPLHDKEVPEWSSLEGKETTSERQKEQVTTDLREGNDSLNLPG